MLAYYDLLVCISVTQCTTLEPSWMALSLTRAETVESRLCSPWGRVSPRQPSSCCSSTFQPDLYSLHMVVQQAICNSWCFCCTGNSIQLLSMMCYGSGKPTAACQYRNALYSVAVLHLDSSCTVNTPQQQTCQPSR